LSGQSFKQLIMDDLDSPLKIISKIIINVVPNLLSQPKVQNFFNNWQLTVPSTIYNLKITLKKKKKKTQFKIQKYLTQMAKSVTQDNSSIFLFSQKSKQRQQNHNTTTSYQNSQSVIQKQNIQKIQNPKITTNWPWPIDVSNLLRSTQKSNLISAIT
jgi:hypothetical protein